ncbi:MAG: hypothetical protein AB1481_02255, partial [Candidatus Omnitrophota bacterium]
TVPHLNLGSLTYRQLWGDIPNFPVLKQMAEALHIKILKAKHMSFGYGLSFSAKHLKQLHKEAGFKDISVGKFDTKVMFKIIPFGFLKKFFTYLADNCCFFWPMIKAVAIK